MQDRFQEFGVKLMPLSRLGFRAGIVVSAVIMPLEIVPAWVISVLSVLFTLLVLQYPILKWVTGENSPPASTQNSQIIALAFALPFAGLLLSAVLAHPSPSAAHIVRITFFFVLRGWIIARYAEPADLALFERSVLWVAVAIIGFGYFQYIGDLLGVSVHITQLISQYSSHGTYFFPRVHSLAHEPLYLANYLLLPIALLIWRILAQKKLDRLKVGFLIAALGLFLSTNARGAIAGLVLAIAVSAAISMPAWKQIRRIGVCGIAGVLLAVAMILLAGLVTGQNTLHSFSRHAIESNDKSFTNRSGTWPFAFHAFNSSPFVGIGPANSRHYIAGQTDYSLPVTSLPVFNNSFLTLIAEQGIVGVIGFLPLVLIILKSLFDELKKRANTRTFPFVLAALAVAIQANTFEISELARSWILIGVLVGAYRIDMSAKEHEANLLIVLQRTKL